MRVKELSPYGRLLPCENPLFISSNPDANPSRNPSPSLHNGRPGSLEWGRVMQAKFALAELYRGSCLRRHFELKKRKVAKACGADAVYLNLFGVTITNVRSYNNRSGLILCGCRDFLRRVMTSFTDLSLRQPHARILCHSCPAAVAFGCLVKSAEVALLVLPRALVSVVRM